MLQQMFFCKLQILLSGGKLSTVNRSTGMDTVGLLTQMGILNPI